ncbi:MAG TPA: hypothetical protein VKE40_21015 [Gemmataceae bacterium]|nr:hypothetical protein [Gemmataceae bacterium]
MRPRIPIHVMALACGLLILPGQTATADVKKEEKPALSGTWAMKDGQLKMQFSGKDGLKIHPHGDKDQFAVVCSYTVTKDGSVKAKITEIEASDEIKEKVKDILRVGLEFRFKWKVKGDSAKLEELDGKDVAQLKSHMEGEYEKKGD